MDVYTLIKIWREKKCYYADNHESEENIAYRRDMLKWYFNYEVRAHLWVQISVEEATKLEEDEAISLVNGYKYNKISNNGKELTFYEFHLDDSPKF